MLWSFLNKSPERGQLILCVVFTQPRVGEKRGDLLGRVRIMAPNRLLTGGASSTSRHLTLPFSSSSPIFLMHAGMSAQSQHFHKREDGRRRWNDAAPQPQLIFCCKMSVSNLNARAWGPILLNLGIHATFTLVLAKTQIKDKLVS